ncbi:MAG: micrococcal nuclease [Solirubrobacteraceae bacterium]|jgi:endonuclease YncB( thermonuclease family)|nr:micrococcal nuclease [Solirubrobacteraceae bacterium]
MTVSSTRSGRDRIGRSGHAGSPYDRNDMWKVVVACAVIGGIAAFVLPERGREPAVRDHRAVVVRVVDGDTIVLAGVGKARLIGVDTPEVFGADAPQCFGAAASAYAKRALTGVTVRWAWGRERRDRYQRALVYAWLPDGRFFNEELLTRGMARVLTIAPNNRYQARFQTAQHAARDRGAGLWRACAGSNR